MLTVHHLNNSRSQRVLWLLEELGLEYEIERYKRDAETMRAPDSLKKVHPLGKSPVVTDGELTLAESGAIVEYLVNCYGNGRLVPTEDSAAKLRYTYWLHYAEGSAMPPLLFKLVMGQVEEKASFWQRPLASAVTSQVNDSFIDPEISLHLGYMESELVSHAWFAGETFTAADIQMSFPIEVAAASADFSRQYPVLAAFLARIHERPAYQQALKRGGEYEVLG
ncbi:MAG: glutathione S-transferase [Phormidesmis sp.]